MSEPNGINTLLRLKKVVWVILTLVVLQFGAIVYLFNQNRILYCDLNDAFFAERQYFYPFLKELGFQAEKYGKDIYGVEYLNPITTQAKYSSHCNLLNAWRF